MFRTIREVNVVLLGSLLLFLIQPIAGQRLLATYGGSPAVWLACLMFFQAALFLGYVWAWFVTRFRSLYAQILLQACLLVATLWGYLPLDIQSEAVWQSSWKPVEVTVHLTVQLLLPIIALASVSPLIQSWGSRVPGRRPPYWLYSISNFASLLALATYPFWIQTRWDLRQQLILWSTGMILFMVLFAWNMMASQWLERLSERLPAEEFNQAGAPREFADSDGARGSLVVWLWASFLPAVLLMSVSNQIGADVAAGPLFWTLPLASYLATFTLAFAWKWRLPWGPAWALTGLIVMVVTPIVSPWVSATTTVVSGCLSLFVVSLHCHQVLVRHQPSARRLTAYYLWISAGGLLGGVFSNLIAPLVFSNYFELELAVLATAVFVILLVWRSSHSPVNSAKQSWRRGRQRIEPMVVALLTLVVVLTASVGVIRKWPIRQLGNGRTLLVQKRTFHGVFRVLEQTTDLGTVRTFGHGWTDHGRRLIDGSDSELPGGYYSLDSGLAAAFLEARRGRDRGLDVCILGLGAGNMLTWKAPQDQFTFVEVDPEVIRLQEKYFSLNRHDPTVQMVTGDGRKFLENVDQKFDMIVMDAFSGDSVPAHLLTQQAMDVYLNRLRVDGVLAVHISNRYLDFEPVLRHLAEVFNLAMVRIETRPGYNRSLGRLADDWVSSPMGPTGQFVPGLRQKLLVGEDVRASNWVLLSHIGFQEGTRRLAAPQPNNSTLIRPWQDDYTPFYPLLK